MGSFFAGVKAGTLTGILYAGGLAAFASAVLLAFKSQFTSYIIQSPKFSDVCGVAGSATNSTALGLCYSSQFSLFVPFMAFIIFFVVLAWSALFGIWYESIPGKSALIKGEVLTTLMVSASFLVIGVPYGYAFSYETALATGCFLVVWSACFGYLLARLYRRYTREVTIESQDRELLRVIVDGRDVTGRLRTFALTSSHRLRAELSDDASFKEWEVTGGVTVEDARSFDTVVEINGEGKQKGIVTRKY